MPVAPSQKEVEEHSTTRWPFRNWRAHCVRGKAKSAGHLQRRYESEVPIIVIDYMWMTEEDEKETGHEEYLGTPILTAIDDSSEWMGAWVAPEKVEHWYAINMLAGFVHELGCKHIILKSEQERAICVKSAVEREMDARVVFSGIACGRVTIVG